MLLKTGPSGLGSLPSARVLRQGEEGVRFNAPCVMAALEPTEAAMSSGRISRHMVLRTLRTSLTLSRLTMTCEVSTLFQLCDAPFWTSFEEHHCVRQLNGTRQHERAVCLRRRHRDRGCNCPVRRTLPTGDQLISSGAFICTSLIQYRQQKA